MKLVDLLLNFLVDFRLDFFIVQVVLHAFGRAESQLHRQLPIKLSGETEYFTIHRKLAPVTDDQTRL